MDRQQILGEIRRIAKDDGRAPGSQRFATVTGIRKSEWYPNLWLRWGDALQEAGLDPNVFKSAYDPEFLVKKYVELINELGRFPVDGELRTRKKKDRSFPSHSTFRTLGTKRERAQKIIEYCDKHGDLEEVRTICLEILPKSQSNKPDSQQRPAVSCGFVYLIKHGRRREYKIGRTNSPMRREGEIKLELPEKVQPIHYIQTDDPAGIEQYWHNRFSQKRKEGEWFELSPEDVRAFKRWRCIF